MKSGVISVKINFYAAKMIMRIMMINFGSLVKIGIRDNSLNLCEKERKKEKNTFFFLYGVK